MDTYSRFYKNITNQLVDDFHTSQRLDFDANHDSTLFYFDQVILQHISSVLNNHGVQLARLRKGTIIFKPYPNTSTNDWRKRSCREKWDKPYSKKRLAHGIDHVVSCYVRTRLNNIEATCSITQTKLTKKRSCHDCAKKSDYKADELLPRCSFC